MSLSLSQNTQAILLLTAHLITGRNADSRDLLTFGEYKKLARFLHENKHWPSDLLATDAESLIAECRLVIDSDRMKRLLDRGFLLSQAVERWQTRAIWVVSRADENYPARLRKQLKGDAPPILYGCGDAGILETGGLAVVGSRHVDDMIIKYTETIGQLAAASRCTIVSGGARGIDQAAMRGALGAGGRVSGVMADSLERAVLNREHRNLLMKGHLILISPYDPSAGFNVGHAMQRNKLIYALSDAALVVNTDYEKGGTWTGAVEQLEKMRLVPVYVRTAGDCGKGIAALRQRGALPWPEPSSPEAFMDVLASKDTHGSVVSGKDGLLFAVHEDANSDYDVQQPSLTNEAQPPLRTTANATPAEELFAKVREILERIDSPKTDAEVAEELAVSKNQAKEWLQRLVDAGVLKKLSKPIRYQSVASGDTLFRERL
ncbi:MAG TPA: DNA-processing protein DprA [Dissulfurispiraceae bacterium]|nr:DNA-processing protein DprA [Dissulfurispiraceae bacterium]